MKQILLTMTAFIMLSANCAFAQVTIGDLKDPESFSILELEGGGTRGLRLPQLSTQERNDMQVTFGAKATADAMGLQIFNIDTKCVETWNGVEWIQICYNNTPAIPPVALSDNAITCGITASNSYKTFTAPDLNAVQY
ncbi:MAG: hypothetical protein LBJ17_00995 [Dysgonamonadaceae bacterium]|jgi:hypothetical protein|nr:hypothetical protein [Dysgonamonadaceae bacterium]